MSEVWWQWIGVVVAVAGGVVLPTTIRCWLRRRRGRLCQGPRRRWHLWLLPWAFLDRRGCFYDLVEHQTRTDPGSACPECGTIVRPRRMFRAPGRVRWGRLFIGLVVGATLLIRHAQRTRGDWMAILPSPALLVVKWARGSPTPRRVGRELDRRLRADTLWRWERHALSVLLLRDLADDHIQGNANDALRQLRSLGDDAVIALERALETGDAQQRQLSAHLLRVQDYPPTNDMLQGTLDGLRDDAFGGYLWERVTSATDGLRFLARHPADIRPFLRMGLIEGDDQQRLFCAVLAVLTRQPELLDDAVPILIGHLRDNHVSEDAKYAAAALRHVGPAARPWLVPWKTSSDRQQREYVERILDVLDDYGDDHFREFDPSGGFLCELHR